MSKNQVEKIDRCVAIIQAYDKIIIELAWIQSEFENAICKSRNEMMKARTEALKDVKEV